MRKGLIGLVVGAAATLGGAWAVKRLLGSDDGGMETQYGGTNGALTETEPPPRREGLDPVLLEILACPDDKQPVIYQKEGEAERLTCTTCGKRYPVRDGIPVMLIDEAQPGPIPTPEEIAAAKAVAPQGKPAIVGAAPGSATSGSAAPSPAAPTAAAGPMSATPGAMAADAPGTPAGTAGMPSSERTEPGKSAETSS
jgi:hypothetical protein